jgi:hypothetical protein
MQRWLAFAACRGKTPLFFAHDLASHRTVMSVDNKEYVEVERNTHSLRSDTDPFSVRLRECLLEEGLDPQRTVLAICFPDDYCFEYGMVVSPEGEVFEFGFDHEDRSVEDGVFSEWTCITDCWRDRIWWQEVATAFSYWRTERDTT